MLPALLALTTVTPPAAAQTVPDSLLTRLEDGTEEVGAAWTDLLESGVVPQLPAPPPSAPTGEMPPGFPRGYPRATGLTLRRQDITADRPGAHLLRFDLTQDRWAAGALLQRDAGETDPADLGRAWGAVRGARWTLLAGDIAVDAGLGWTIATSPSWPAGEDAAAPLRRPPEGVHPNRSSEEGWGWRGGGLHWDYSEGYGLDLWAGTASFDARAVSGGLLPYAGQGDHTGERSETKNALREDHWGVQLRRSREEGGFGLIRWESVWSEHLADSPSPARFRGGGDRPGVTGLWLRRDLAPSGTLFLELAQQDRNALGGTALFALRSQGALATLALYRATVGFQPLHARPMLPFGDDPAGRLGGVLALEGRIPGAEAWRAGGSAAFEGREPTPAGTGAETRWGGRLYGRGPIARNWRLDVRFRLRRTRTGTTDEALDWSHSLRGVLRRKVGGARFGLRGERTWVRHGWGNLVGGEIRREIRRSLGFSGSATYLFPSGSGAALTVIEPTVPGLFPVRRLGGERLRAAGLVTWRPAGGLRVHLLFSAERRLDTGPDGATDDKGTLDTTLTAGVQWFERRTR